jgi:hypothetical protein
MIIKYTSSTGLLSAAVLREYASSNIYFFTWAEGVATVSRRKRYADLTNKTFLDDKSASDISIKVTGAMTILWQVRLPSLFLRQHRLASEVFIMPALNSNCFVISWQAEKLFT